MARRFNTSAAKTTPACPRSKASTHARSGRRMPFRAIRDSP